MANQRIEKTLGFALHVLHEGKQLGQGFADGHGFVRMVKGIEARNPRRGDFVSIKPLIPFREFFENLVKASLVARIGVGRHEGVEEDFRFATGRGSPFARR